MKKIVAILLFGLFILHHVGYYFIYIALKHQINLEWQTKVTNDDFDQDQLQSASIPITFPYQTDQEEFQTVDKSIEIKGRFYRVIKMKYARDTLHLIYVNDYSSEKIRTVFERLAKRMTQNDTTTRTRGSQYIIRMLDNLYMGSEYLFQPLALQLTKLTYCKFYSNIFKEIYLSIPVPPPKFFIS